MFVGSERENMMEAVIKDLSPFWIGEHFGGLSVSQSFWSYYLRQGSLFIYTDAIRFFSLCILGC